MKPGAAIIVLVVLVLAYLHAGTWDYAEELTLEAMEKTARVSRALEVRP